MKTRPQPSGRRNGGNGGKRTAAGVLEPGEPKRPSGGMAVEIGQWAATFLIFLYATTVCAQPFVISSGSMEDTLLVGDHVIVDKLTYAPHGAWSKHLLPYRSPERGDIVVFRHPEKLLQFRHRQWVARRQFSASDGIHGGAQPVQRVIIRAVHRHQQRHEGGRVAGGQFLPRGGRGGIALPFRADGAQDPQWFGDFRRRPGQGQTDPTTQD